MPPLVASAAPSIRPLGTAFGLHAAFAMTGVGTVLLGCLLPVLAIHWGLHDAHAGLLFAAQFAGSASGGFLTRGRYRTLLSIGLALAAISALLLPVANAIAVLPAFFFFGLGMGLSMTCINVLVSIRYPQRRGAALSLLNFSWSVGAACGPLLVSRGLASLHFDGIFRLVGSAFALVLLYLLVFVREPATAPATIPAQSRARTSIALIAFFAAMGFLYVGVENTVGGWIVTYADRTLDISAARAAGFASAFWIALLVGRAISSGVLLVVSERVLYPSAIALSTVGIAMVVLWHTAPGMAAGAVLTGLALAPIFPLNLSLFVTLAGETSNAGTMLALTGFGGSVLPWLTGIVSGRTGSLQRGLLVPIAATVLMLVMLLAANMRGSDNGPQPR